MAHLSRIHIYPIKSLDLVSVNAATVLPTGALSNDRRFAMIDEHGQYVNGKRNARVHLLRSRYDPDTNIFSISGDGSEPCMFDVDLERHALERWLSRFFAMPVTFRENPTGGFPDDLDSPGPTLISTATLQLVAQWFDLTLDEARARFRANLEIDGVPPFWEDQLYGLRGTTVRFRVGEVVFDGINPCQRCVVPSRDHKTGANIPDFAKRFVEMRKKHFPEWAESARFNHFYRLAVNTRLAPDPIKFRLCVGDEVTIIGVIGTPEQQTPPIAPARPERWSGPLRVVRVCTNTPTVRTFRLAATDGDRLPFTYLPGQFLNIEVMIDGTLHRRCYTIASAPTQTAYCELTIKREENGTVSKFLHDHVREGAQLQVFGPGGRFTFHEAEADTLVLIGAGVGITPLLSTIRHLTGNRWPGKIRLLYSAKSESELICNEELKALTGAFANFKVTTTLTRESSSAWAGLRGRITPEMIRQAVRASSNMRVHICGPVEMANSVKEMLRDLGVPDDCVRAEAFGGAAPMVAAASTGPVLGTVTFGDSGKSEPLCQGQTILEVATRAGIAIDRGCMEGICGRCKVRLLSGDVVMSVDEALTPEDKAKGFVLSCQARPTGNIAVDA